MFLGMSFASSDSSASNIALNNNYVSKITLSNSIVDDLYVSINALQDFDWNIPDEWKLDTALHAKYEENLHAGNVQFSVNNVSKVKIKKRLFGDFEWKTIYEKEVNTNDDFAIEFYDYYEPTNRVIEYSYVLEVNTSDHDAAVASIESEFYNYFICGQNGESYPMIINMQNTPTYNRKSSIIDVPGRKTPYVVNNGVSQYYSGNINVSFIAMDDRCNLDTENAWEYRRELDNFLANGEPKILKSYDGEMWMVHVVNNLPRSNSGHYQLFDHQIEWVEAGNPYSIADLYDNGFINTDIDRE